jgi:hypothetical protein
MTFSSSGTLGTSLVPRVTMWMSELRIHKTDDKEDQEPQRAECCHDDLLSGARPDVDVSSSS